MAIETGIVIKLGDPAGRTAWVETSRSSACESCSARGSCNPGGPDKCEVEALNEAGARIGDRIQLAISTASLLKATFLLYLFPVLCMLAGGIAGHLAAGPFYADTTVASASAAFTALAAALLIVRIRGGRLAAKTEYRPRIIRVLSRAGGERINAEPSRGAHMNIGVERSVSENGDFG